MRAAAGRTLTSAVATAVTAFAYDACGRTTLRSDADSDTTEYRPFAVAATADGTTTLLGLVTTSQGDVVGMCDASGPGV